MLQRNSLVPPPACDLLPRPRWHTADTEPSSASAGRCVRREPWPPLGRAGCARSLRLPARTWRALLAPHGPLPAGACPGARVSAMAWVLTPLADGLGAAIRLAGDGHLLGAVDVLAAGERRRGRRVDKLEGHGLVLGEGRGIAVRAGDHVVRTGDTKNDWHVLVLRWMCGGGPPGQRGP